MTKPSSVVLPVLLFVFGCATSRVPQALRGYDIVVEGRDEQSVELARAMREYGFHVRDRIRGGSRPTAVAIHFIFSDSGPGQPSWLALRLADTRSGVIVGASTVQLDSVVPNPRARAAAVVRALAP